LENGARNQRKDPGRHEQIVEKIKTFTV
jgi:hypothetical protein